MSRRSLEQMAAQRDRSGSLWLMQAFSGLLLVGLLGVHMIAHHFIVEGGLRDYQQVLDYVSNPIVFTLEVLFVIFGVVHALLGVQSIITDLRPSAGTLRAVEWILRIVGLIAIGYGIYLAIALQRLAG
jgi:succinate dehydrogenase / fumarate reductase membrane anchor subunit